MMSSEPPPELAWTRVRPGGASYRTHRVLVRGDRLEFVPSRGALAIVVGPALFTLCLALVWFAQYLAEDDEAALVPALLSLLTGMIVAWITKRMLISHRVFDRAAGRYWDTREGGTRRRPGREAIALTEIRGVQIVREHVTGPESDYDADELDLVLGQDRRINVVDHGDLAGLRRDAETVARWLGVPLWTKLP